LLHLFIFHLQNDPQEGAKHGGTAGFLKGLGSGLVEAVQRPAEGISILTHQLGTGLKKTPDAIFGEENRGYGPPLVGELTLPHCRTVGVYFFHDPVSLQLPERSNNLLSVPP
jgi:hypothetical protein